MDTNIIEKEVTYYRFHKDDSDFLIKQLSFNALFVKDSASSFYPFKSKFPEKTYIPSGIDKVRFPIHLDFVNEHSSIIKSQRNGPVSLEKNGAYLNIDIHREFFLPKDNVLECSATVIWELLRRGLFKIPKTKETYRVVDATKTYNTYDHVVKSLDDFFDVIWSQLEPSLLEIYFDYLYKIRKYFNDLNFRVEKKTTLYSLDYSVRGNGSKKLSYVCIYDKKIQFEEVKNIFVDESWSRVEFRLQKGYSIMQSKEFLDGTFEEIFPRLEDTMVRKLRKLDNEYPIDWTKFHSVLEEDDKLKHLLDRAFYGKTEKYHQQTPKNKVNKKIENQTTEEIESNNDTEVSHNEEESNQGSVSILEKLNSLFNVINSKDFKVLCAIKTVMKHIDYQNNRLNSYIIRGP